MHIKKSDNFPCAELEKLVFARERREWIMTNVQQAEAVIKKYKFNFSEIPKEEIRKLIKKEISNFQEGSSEYIRPREEIIESLILENQKIIKIPIVRNGKQMKLKRRLKVY